MNADQIFALVRGMETGEDVLGDGIKSLMAARIINPNPSPKVEEEIDCPNCGTRLAYTPVDTRTFEHKDYTGDSSTYTVLDCPKCAHAITLSCH